jgi:hypothetical protein
MAFRLCWCIDRPGFQEKAKTEQGNQMSVLLPGLSRRMHRTYLATVLASRRRTEFTRNGLHGHLELFGQ